MNSDMEICLCRSRLSVSQERFGGTTLTERVLDLVLYELEAKTFSSNNVP